MIRCTSPIFRFVFVVLLFVVSFGLSLSGEMIDQRNFAIDTYYPTPDEIRLAEQRARNYWAKNVNRYGSNPVYLAVETSKIFESEIVQESLAQVDKLANNNLLFRQIAGATSYRSRLKGNHGF